MVPTVTVRGEALGVERWAVLDGNVPLPNAIFAVEGVHGTRYTAKVRLVPIPERNERGVLCSPTQPDFGKLGVVLDLVRETGVVVDLSKVPGWQNKGIGK